MVLNSEMNKLNMLNDTNNCFVIMHKCNLC